jgi:dolichol kinase
MMKRIWEEVMSLQLLGGGLPDRLHLRTDLHLTRKAWHMAMGMLIAFIFMSGLSVGASIAILSVFFALAFFVETARLRNPAFNEKVIRFWGPVMRHNEVRGMSGTPYYLAATIVAIAVFPRPVAVMSILFLACGDPIASLMGILFGDRSIRFSNGKSLIGTLSGVVACGIVAYFLLLSLALPPYAIALLTVIGGLAGGTAELLPVEIDDNFTIPVVSGFVMWLAFILLGL